MKYKLKFLFCSIILSIIFTNMVYAADIDNSSLKRNAETRWLTANKGKTFIVGITPQTGADYFTSNGKEQGYMLTLVNKMSSDLGINLKLKVSNNWSEVYSGLQKGSIDILYGANETPERDKFMAFTKPFYKTPYVIISKKDGPVHTIGDLDNRRVGFIENDFAADSLPKLYKNISFSKTMFWSREAGLDALKKNDIDAFVTSGGPVIYDYMNKYPELDYTFKINSITSDLTFSAKKHNNILIDILNRELSQIEGSELDKIINDAEVSYNLKIMNLTDEEQKWLASDGTAIVGITKDYLPFDYYENGDFKGIDGSIIKEISRMTGIKFRYYYSDFDDLYDRLKAGDINLLNLAKTEEREKYVIYLRPFNTERDIIVGRKEEKDVKDIFGLEGKSVAVIKGYWHYDMLTKNLTNVKIIETNNIQESMNLVNSKKADYLIENPSVIDYYREELELYDLVQRGITSTDSFLYFGVSKNKPELASIINKTLPMMDIEDLSRKGYEEVPHTYNKQKNQGLIFTIAGLLLLLVIIIFYLIKVFKDFIREKTEKELLKQREYLLSIDTLTELYNRNYLQSKVVPALDEFAYPQILIIADVNDLKFINDNYGHHAGDILLKSFAEAFKEGCPSDAQLFRVGGDEFLSILASSSENAAIETLSKIREYAAEKTLEFKDGKKFSVKAALGYAIRYSKDVSFEELYETADMYMYSDKRKKKAKEKND